MAEFEAPSGAPSSFSVPCRNILLASHGTTGARAAENLALELIRERGSLRHLLVVPELWQGMMGDDWLNNVRTRITYGEYLEGVLSREIAESQDRIARATEEKGVEYLPAVMQGDPAQCLVEYAADVDCDLVVIGAPRPKGEQGLRSRLKLEPLVRALVVPLLVAPRPHE